MTRNRKFNILQKRFIPGFSAVLAAKKLPLVTRQDSFWVTTELIENKRKLTGLKEGVRKFSGSKVVA